MPAERPHPPVTAAGPRRRPSRWTGAATLCLALLALPLAGEAEAKAHEPDFPTLALPQNFGVSVHGIDDAAASMIENAGFGIVRMDLHWALTEKKARQYDWGH